MRYLLPLKDMGYTYVGARNGDVFDAKFKSTLCALSAFVLGFLALFSGGFFCRFLRFGRFFRAFGFAFCFCFGGGFFAV